MFCGQMISYDLVWICRVTSHDYVRKYSYNIVDENPSSLVYHSLLVLDIVQEEVKRS